MSDILNKASVLVLNRNWQAVNTRTPADAFCQMAADAATGLDIDGESMNPVKWAQWLSLPVRPQDASVRTQRGPVRVPTVIVLANYARVPKTRPKLCPRSIRARDGGVCQYTGRKLAPHEGSVDHVVPRSKDGATSWENCVLADKRVNAQKGDRLPHEAGLRLLRKPAPPRELPSTALINNVHAIPDWKHFLL